MMRATARVARKTWQCSSVRYDGCKPIQPGDVYLVHVASPNDPDLGNEGWQRLAECGPCATRCGRGQLIEERRAKIAAKRQLRRRPYRRPIVDVHLPEFTEEAA